MGVSGCAGRAGELSCDHGFDALSAKNSTGCRFLLLRKLFCSFQIDPWLNVLISNFFSTRNKLST